MKSKSLIVGSAYSAPDCTETSLCAEEILCQSITATTTETLSEEQGQWE